MVIYLIVSNKIHKSNNTILDSLVDILLIQNIKDIKVYEISNSQKKNIVNLINNNSSLNINSDLKRKIKFDNKRLLDIKSYRGIRKYKGFPVRGQRTKTNSKTAKKYNRF